MGAFKCVITVEGPIPPRFMLGDDIGGGVIITEMKKVDEELVSTSQLALKYNLSVQTVRRKLAQFNQGSNGKGLYSIKIADEILNPKTKQKTGGAKRKN
ncbi:DNA-binding protein [Acinetobacter nectaris]|uniref:DNA-binding protein n=1 Tax=Acinetobacter nectaris TaxID=1219382 RepID=UPI001F3C4A20|nr:DNA-binding protein [Acinetobacter nectaris]MCF9035307.1 DNA-binding protein [Acinetobacter nectaris]